MIPLREIKQEVKRVTRAMKPMLQMQSQEAGPGLQALHAQFVQCINTVNARLEACDELLRKGLRNEAIQECEIEPSLLDLVTELDLPEWDAWAHYVRGFGIPPQPDLLLDAAVALNEAYNQAQPLENLLHMQRLHAIARSPLSTRISVLRAIAKKDPSNYIWQEDLRSFENARFRQLEGEVKQHTAERDLRALGDLRREVCDSPWLEPPPTSLVQRVAQNHQQLLAEQSREQLVALENELNQAFSEFNVARATQARDEWERHFASSGLTEASDEYQRVIPALEWLEQESADQSRQEEFQQALGLLENALDDGQRPREQIEQLYHVAERFEEPIPSHVQRRYQERIRGFKSAVARRSLLIWSSALAATLAVVTLTTLFVQARMRGNAVRVACTDLSTLLEEDRIDEANRLYNTIAENQPYIMATPRMQKLHSTLRERVNQDQARSQRFELLLKTADDYVQGEPSWEAVASAASELKTAKTLAKGERELGAVKNVEVKVQAEQQRLQRAVDEAFQAEVTAIATQMTDLAALDLETVQGLKVKTNALIKRPRVSALVRQRNRLHEMATRLQDRETAIIATMKNDTALAAVTKAIGDATAFRQALENYNRVVEAGGRVDDFKNVLSTELAFLQHVEKWNAIVKRWKEVSFDKPESIIANGLPILKDIDADFDEFPPAQPVLEMKEQLRAYGRRKDATGVTVLKTLEKYFRQDMFTMNYLIDAQGRRFYFFGEPKPDKDNEGKITINLLRDIGDLSRIKRDRPFFVSQLRKFEDSRYFDQAPHTKFATAARAHLAKPNLTYENYVCGVLSLLFEDKEVDPVIKVGVLQGVVGIAKPGSTILAEELDTFEKAISTREDLDRVNWLSNEDDAVADHRVTLTSQLERIRKPPREVYVDQIKDRVAHFQANKPVVRPVQWIGFMLKEGDDWNCIVKDLRSEQEGQLLLRDSALKKIPRFIILGDWKDGEPQWHAEAESSFIEAKPVFFSVTEK